MRLTPQENESGLLRLLCEGQIHGGVAQGVGQALMESIAFDADVSQTPEAESLDPAESRAKLFEKLFHFVHQGETLVNEDLVNPPGVSESKRRSEDLRDMARSQDTAAAVALKYLGKKVVFHPRGALVGRL